MSFTDDDKEALGEDLDELKTNLANLEHRATGIQKDLRTLVTMAWVYIILNAVGAIVIGLTIYSSGD
jgi:membrane-bound ClpP family serine protease